MLLAAVLAAQVVIGHYHGANGTEQSYLDLTPDQGFCYVLAGCFHYAKWQGRWKVQNDALLLTPPPDPEQFPFTDDRLRIVQWDKAKFLVPEADLCRFAAVVQSGWKGDSERNTFLRLGPDGPLEGRPVLPLPWKDQLERPLTPHVTRIVGATLALDAGSSEGLRPQTALATKVGGVLLFALVDSVRAHEATAHWGTFDDHVPTEFRPGVALGFDAPEVTIVPNLRSSLRSGSLIPTKDD